MMCRILIVSLLYLSHQGNLLAANLLTNPGFETGSANGWPGSNGTIITSGWYQGAGPRSGTYAYGTASNWNTNQVLATQTVSVSGGQNYRVSGWFWFFCNSSSCVMTTVRLRVKWRDGNGSSMGESDSGVTNATEHPQQQYFELSRIWNAPPGAISAEFQVDFIADGQGGGGWGICVGDDFTFEPTGGGPTPTPEPGGRKFWLLTYGRQFGKYVTGVTIPINEVYAFYETGVPAVGMGVTNKANPGYAYYGQTDVNGKLRIDLPGRSQPHDVLVFDWQGIPSSPSVDVYWQSPLPDAPTYIFEFLYTRVPDYDRITAYPYNPVYHYDLVNGFNTSTSEAPGRLSDQFSLSDWSDNHSQTFVVPAGINRIIATKVHSVNGSDNNFRVRASVHEGRVGGPQVGPTLYSRPKSSIEFKGFMMCWDIDDVPVVPGNTYAITFSAEGSGENVYATDTNTYTNGSLYVNDRAVPGRDLLAVVIGLHVEEAIPPTPTPTPTVQPSSHFMLR